jgi:hypothetical protein
VPCCGSGWDDFTLIFIAGTSSGTDDQEVSCQSLKKSGILTNSIYTLKRPNDKFPRVSHCAMDTVGYETETMENFIGYIGPVFLYTNVQLCS